MTLPLAALLQGAVAGGPTGQTYVDDVFSTYLYTGNGSTQTITNGIDLAGKGGLVWIKKRGVGVGDHHLYDTVRGATNMISSNTTGGTIVRSTGLTAFNSNGFSIGAYSEINGSGDTQVSWTFRKAPKFFDVVTWTGNNTGQSIPHNLGVAPGMVIVKSYSGASAASKDWYVYHRSVDATTPEDYYMVLNTTAARVLNGNLWDAPTSTHLILNTAGGVNETGHTYVAYLFAHDTSADGIIQCGSVTTDGSGNSALQNIGWEPQFVMTKGTTYAGSNDQWLVCDSIRGINKTSNPYLSPNSSSAENFFGVPGPWINPDASGFKIQGLNANTTYIYLAIRRPNKPPTSGTQVYNAIARTGTGAAATVTGVGFAPDMILSNPRDQGSGKHLFDRLRGKNNYLMPNGANAEDTSFSNTLTSFDMDGFSVGADSTATINWSGHTIINWCFRRAPGFFDVVVANNNGTTGVFTSSHNLGVTPTLSIARPRTASQNWMVAADTGSGYRLLNLNQNYSDQGAASFTASATSFTWSAYAMGFGNDSSIAYLFASLPGISKVGSYTGNGSSQTINCGFAAGARFILIKRTDSTGDWYVWDSARGIVAANDPHLSLNTTAAEVTTDDSIDPANEGFSVNQVAATNINVTSATYIFLALS